MCRAIQLVVLSAGVWLGASSVLLGQDSPGPFQSISLPDALAKAHLENKIVLIDFFTTWCGPCKRLDATTWRDAAVVDLLHQKTIAVRLDAEKNADLAKKYSVQVYPSLVLLKPDGTVIDTLTGYQDAATFIGKFNSSLAGKTSLIQAQDAVTKAHDADSQVQARYELGQQIERDGRQAEALAEYILCYDIGMKQDAKYEGVRHSFLLGDLGQLAKRYPPAREALMTRRAAAVQAMRANPSDIIAAREASDLNRSLGEDTVTLAYFDKLPASSPQREAIGGHVFELLLSAKRYRDAVSAAPYPSFKEQFLRGMQMRRHAFPAAEFAALLKCEVEIASREVESLAGAGQLDDARDLIKQVLIIDKSTETVLSLKAHLAAAGHSDLM